MNEKKELLRGHIRDMLAAMEPELMAAKSRLACEKLLKLPEFSGACAVMIYLSADREVDTVWIATAAWQDGKIVLAPKVNIEEQHMIAVECNSLETGLAPGSFGILEPTDGQARPIESIDLLIVPGLAFDRRGNRLGRGAGLYDRFLSAPGMRATTAALAFSEQVFDSVPVGRTDRHIDILVTDKEVVRLAGNRRRRPASKEPYS